MKKMMLKLATIGSAMTMTALSLGMVSHANAAGDHAAIQPVYEAACKSCHGIDGAKAKLTVEGQEGKFGLDHSKISTTEALEAAFTKEGMMQKASKKLDKALADAKLTREQAMKDLLALLDDFRAGKKPYGDK